MGTQPFFPLLRQAFFYWKKDRASSLAAALTYHALFSITPLLIVILSITEFVYQRSPTQQFLTQLQSFIGNDAAKIVKDLLEQSTVASQRGLALLIGTIITLIGSIGVFTELKKSLDVIWHIPDRKTSLQELLGRYLGLFLLVILTSLVLIASLSLDAILSSNLASSTVQLSIGSGILSLLHQCISIGIITALFALLFKALPDTLVHWKYVWRAALLTSIILACEKYLFSLYLAHSTINSAYGAAGSLVALLLWIFYSAQVFLFGAELTKVEQEAEQKEKKLTQSITPVR